MFNILQEKPVISNQHGALVMAFVPFLYGAWQGGWSALHLPFALAWFSLYLFSYPFLQLFSRKPTARNQKWAAIYAFLALVFGLPLLIAEPPLLRFLFPMLPLALVQIYFAKCKDERHLLNDLAGILTFGTVGMASAFLTSGQYHWQVLLHPTLFFLATTLYIKSVARERRNPRYLQLSLAIHALLAFGYFAVADFALGLAYLIALARAAYLPRKSLNIKQIGLLEFGIVLIFMVALATTSGGF